MRTPTRSSTGGRWRTRRGRLRATDPHGAQGDGGRATTSSCADGQRIVWVGATCPDVSMFSKSARLILMAPRGLPDGLIARIAPVVTSRRMVFSLTSSRVAASTTDSHSFTFRVPRACQHRRARAWGLHAQMSSSTLRATDLKSVGGNPRAGSNPVLSANPRTGWRARTDAWRVQKSLALSLASPA